MVEHQPSELNVDGSSPFARCFQAMGSRIARGVMHDEQDDTLDLPVPRDDGRSGLHEREGGRPAISWTETAGDDS